MSIPTTYTWCDAIHPKHLISPFICRKEGIKEPINTRDQIIRVLAISIITGLAFAAVGFILSPWLSLGLGLGTFVIVFYAGSALAKYKKIQDLAKASITP